MKRVLRIAGWSLLIAALLGTLLAAATVAAVGAFDPALIEINGETFDLARLGAGHGLLAVGGVLLAALIVLLIVPLALLLPMLVVAVVLIGVMLVLAGVVTLVFSPLILLVGAGWLIWRLARRARTAAKPDATIAQ